MSEWLHWLQVNPWAGWFAVAALLGVAELLSMDFVLLMVAVGLTAGGVAALLSATLPLQILVAVVVSMGTLAFVRPSIVRQLHKPNMLIMLASSGHDNATCSALVGQYVPSDVYSHCNTAFAVHAWGGARQHAQDAALVGRSAMVIEEITSQSGQVKLAGEVWTARPYDDSLVIPAGSTVDVFEIRGATAVVFPVETPQL